jgi:hypothetical protein
MLNFPLPAMGGARSMRGVLLNGDHVKLLRHFRRKPSGDLAAESSCGASRDCAGLPPEPKNSTISVCRAC